jgi:Flp pilus assembly protein TadG
VRITDIAVVDIKEMFIMRRKFTSQKGAALVEFAIVIIPLMIITFGIIEFGVYFYDKNILTNASREGARAGIVAGLNRVSETEINAVVMKYCQNHLITFGSSPNLTMSTPIVSSPPSIIPAHTIATAAFGDTLTITVNYHYSFLILPRLLTGLIPGLNNIGNMHATTIMKYE